jgi:hypothetical protein
MLISEDRPAVARRHQAYYDQAIDICTKTRFRRELALSRLELAELLLGDDVRRLPCGRPSGLRLPYMRTTR